MTRRALVLTISDSVAAGLREDVSGPAVRAQLEAHGWRSEADALPDERERIADALRRAADQDAYALVLTTGGTGLAARDVTPEATREIIEREIPGLGEWMRSAGMRHTPRAVLSRGIAGTRKRTLIVNLPGSPAGAVQSLGAISGLLPHVIDLLEGNTEHAAGGETPGETGTSQNRCD